MLTIFVSHSNVALPELSVKVDTRLISQDVIGILTANHTRVTLDSIETFGIYIKGNSVYTRIPSEITDSTIFYPDSFYRVSVENL